MLLDKEILRCPRLARVPESAWMLEFVEVLFQLLRQPRVLSASGERVASITLTPPEPASRTGKKKTLIWISIMVVGQINDSERLCSTEFPLLVVCQINYSSFSVAGDVGILDLIFSFLVWTIYFLSVCFCVVIQQCC
ncbi:unnamed protein product [Cuscuta epithymum]|uniref:Uncharacterized protein n=1 Tax=Cuscuta epithymum TaxID=186058 RepID=A0AAV0DHR3_9ASTE|nr:unnamed protein product [Cuscuta epithymum]